ncbi:putative sulfate exporter family transporter, partial [Mogibacterium pumilum]|uniref:putative sulfate exporter family transporter n=1 Tax=Mogibacterium pumilum TaxID=86332 RepID=UPI001F00B921
MNSFRTKMPGVIVCFVIAVPAWLIGKLIPVIGGPVFSILFGMVITVFWTEKGVFAKGIKFTSKYILQTAVVLLGVGLNLGVILETGV